MMSHRRRRANTLARAKCRPRIARLAVVVLAFALLGCGSRRPTAAELIGTYQASDGAALILHENGQLAVIQFPIHEVGMKPFEWRRVDGSGEWSVAPPEYEHEDWLRLVLRERSDGGVAYGTSLFTGGSGESTYLYTYLGDPDDSPPYEFKRETK